MHIKSKLPHTETSIFTVMTALAKQENAINLAQGFPDFKSSPELIERVHQYMLKGFNQYAPMAGVPALRERIAEKIAITHNAKVDMDREITLTAGATQAIFTIIAAFVHPGDEVILLEPAYDSYQPSIEINGGIPIPYPMQSPDYQIDWLAFGNLITPRTRMIFINSPHNPTGLTLKAEDYAQLEALVKNTNIIVLSDEVYEHLVYDEKKPLSVLQYPGLRERSFAVFSFGKTFHNTGWKLGYAVAPEPLMEEFRKVHQFNVFSVNTPIQYALAYYMADPQTYLGLGNFFQEKRDYFLELMTGSRFKPLKCEGTYFHLYDFSAISDEQDTDFATRITKEHGVATIPVSPFYARSPRSSVLRFCFAKEKETLERAAALLVKI
ncbi:MAG: aminotransferase class I/II-fold pyridoxal phosphate-dependent enzyme [Saprospiraceae bacterium]|nr:aminotransferase class I/II-fold pyridoxal phosphate-dependent enzyme [Saprospiraceae bacterium]MCB9325302.1 aminotransferase class I/II-fold pyridoxal phosphate-dependent enzyme [Lewinellaceae bacterium]